MITRSLTHTNFGSATLHYYMGLVLDREEEGRGAMEYILEPWFLDEQGVMETEWGPALMFGRNFHTWLPSGYDYAMPTVYAEYVALDLVDLYLEGAINHLLPDGFFERFARTIAHLMLVGDASAPTVTTDLAGGKSVTFTTPSGKLREIPDACSTEGFCGTRSQAQYGEYGYHILIPWDTSGRLRQAGAWSFAPWGPLDQPKRLAYPAGLLLAEALGNQNPVVIVHPFDRAEIQADGPVRIWASPSVEIAQVTLTLDGTPVFQGAAIPEGINLLSLLPAIDPQGHRLEVEVVDTSGKAHRQASEFKVRQAILSLDDPLLRLEGDVALDFTANAGYDDPVRSVTLSLVPVVQEGANEAAAGRKIVVFSGDKAPDGFTLHTTEYEDGAYDLVLRVETVRGEVATDTRRVLLRNWDVLHDPLLPPLTSGWLGSVDRLRSSAKSTGWKYFAGQPQDFSGDADRLGLSAGHGEEFLVWEMPGIYRAEFTLFARGDLLRGDAQLGVDAALGTNAAPGTDISAAIAAALSDRIRIELSADNAAWRKADFETQVLDTSNSGWTRVVVRAKASDQTARFVRLTFLAERAPGEMLQLGEVRILGRAAGQ